MTDRRERYEAEIGAKDIYNVHVIRMAAEAAMAVADAEHEEWTAATRELIARQKARIARLRAELKEAQRDHREDTHQLAEMRDTITRLRRELKGDRS